MPCSTLVQAATRIQSYGDRRALIGPDDTNTPLSVTSLLMVGSTLAAEQGTSWPEHYAPATRAAIRQVRELLVLDESHAEAMHTFTQLLEEETRHARTT